MLLEIFDVEHGASALVTTSNGKRLMIDCGHNATTGWRPGTALVRAAITSLDHLFVTNYDEDHVSGYPNLIERVSVKALFRNPSVSPGIIRQLKTEDGMGVGIDALVRSIEGYFTGGPATPQDLGDTTFSTYWNNYGVPPLGFDDENNLSLVVFIKCGHHKIIFPGDMEKAGWRKLLHNPAFAAELHGVNFFVASHHGRENGYCEELMNLCPQIDAVIISDQQIGFQSQETVNTYRQHARGFSYGTETRRVLTTRRDSSIQISMTPTGIATVRLGLAA